MSIRRSSLSILRMRGFACCVAVLATIGASSISADGGEPDSTTQAAREQFFEQNVRPLLAENCYSCHGDKKQKGGLRLDSLEAILKGGESGPAVVPGKPDESLLVEAINYEGLEMPPNGKLGPEKVAVLTRWVSLGAPWPSRDRAAHAPSSSISPRRSKLTAARPVHLVAPTRSPDRSFPTRSIRTPTTGPAGRETRSTASSSRLSSTTV